MARNFSSTDARRISKDYTELLNNLALTNKIADKYSKSISQNANVVLAKLSMDVLNKIPIEELNRNKGHIRVKALRDSGYETLADIAAANVYNLSAVRGISQDTAYTIKKLAGNISSQALEDVKIRLSLDNRTKEISELVLSIAKYIRCKAPCEVCADILSSKEKEIKYAIEDMSPGTGDIKWFFTSKAKKERAEQAYFKLKELWDSETINTARENLSLLNKIDETTVSQAWQDFSENPIKFNIVLEDVVPGVLSSQDAAYGLPEELAREIQEQVFFPDGLLCDLRPYQVMGVKYILHQEKVLLGDEMGLGKTVQAIATMVSLQNTGATHFMVVCPASVLTNWCREIREKSKLTVTKIHGYSKDRALNSWMKTGGVAVTTYETTSRFNFSENFTLSLLVVDEAHYIKNPQARRSASVTAVAERSERLLFMTGTALENNVDEMITLISLLQPQIANLVINKKSLASAPSFRRTIAPVYYRRKQEDVLSELPELNDTPVWCTLLPEEEEIYENTLIQRKRQEARRLSWQIENLDKSSKAIRMMEIIKEAEADGRKVIIFSFFLKTIEKIIDYLGDRCTNPINGSVSPERRQQIIDEFEKAPAGTVLPAQIQAGGTGLNIQAASVVILCEPQFKPSIENQAIARAYRMGQTRSVLVYRLLCANTIDELLTERLRAKQKLFDEFADRSAAYENEPEIDIRTFNEIIQQEIDRINEKNGNFNDKPNNEE